MELIDKRRLVEHCFEVVCKLDKQGDNIAADAIKKHILWYLVDVESIDAVPVVRCRDCKHYEIHKPKVLENCERNGYIIPKTGAGIRSSFS